MKFFFIIISICFSLSCNAYPLRDPKPGEFRPTWWLSLWYKDLCYGDGVLVYDTNRDYDLTITFKDSEGHTYTEYYKSGKFTPKKFSFSTRGFRYSRGYLSKRQFETEMAPIPVVVRRLKLDDGFTPLIANSDSKYYLLFKESSIKNYMTISDVINGEMDEAQRIFKFREKIEKDYVIRE